MSKRPVAGPLPPTKVELDYIKQLQSSEALPDALSRAVQRIRSEASSTWLPVDAIDVHQSGDDPYSADWLKDLQDLSVEGELEPHPYVCVRFRHYPSGWLIAHDIPLVDDNGEEIYAAISDLRIRLDTARVTKRGVVSAPDANGYRWLH